MKHKLILVFCIIILIFFSCKSEEIILHGEISGQVTDTTNSQPIQAVPVKLNPVNDITSTSSDGKYLFKSLIPGDYKIEVSKPPYATEIKKAKVTSAKTNEINFAIHKISYPRIYPKYLDFGFDSTLKSFTIKNTGTGKLNYSLFPTQDWITVNPNIGEATTETDTLKVAINRNGLSEKKHVESIEIISNIGLDLVKDTVYILVNGFMDQDSNYYGIVTIGTQTWMADNLNIGREIQVGQEQQNNGIIEKWCYDCKTYGGLYNWREAMQYNPSDTGIVGKTQGVCPTGWHIPTPQEIFTLRDYLGGRQAAGGKLKETGTVHWLPPNEGATNESGFTALSGGYSSRGDDWFSTNPIDNHFVGQGTDACFCVSCYIPPIPPQNVPETGDFFSLSYNSRFINGLGVGYPLSWGVSVRCIKDPAKK
jgi:uncharacterized protein (TIGR02145 family)